MDGISIGLWLVALIMGGIAFSRPERLHRQGMKIAWENIVVMVPRIAMAIVVAGLFAVILPTELVANWLGRDSGLMGIIAGSLAGGVTPGGPMLSFPIVTILFKAGAGIGPLIAYLTAWSVFALHRVFAFEVPMMGARFALLRLASPCIFPGPALPGRHPGHAAARFSPDPPLLTLRPPGHSCGRPFFLPRSDRRLLAAGVSSFRSARLHASSARPH